MNAIQEENVLIGQDVSLNWDRFEVFADSRQVTLTLTEFKILSILLKDAGSVKTRHQLLENIAPNHKIAMRNIDVHIQSIRRKLGQPGKYLVTIRGLGYKWSDRSNPSSAMNSRHYCS